MAQKTVTICDLCEKIMPQGSAGRLILAFRNSPSNSGGRVGQIECCDECRLKVINLEQIAFKVMSQFIKEAIAALHAFNEKNNAIDKLP